jgi:protocatechuate 3,4-dioxygenase alpha subunit
MALPATPPQTIGPFFHVGLDVPGTERLVPGDHPGALRIHGRVVDGAGQPVGDALLEMWDPDGGRFGRCATDPEGGFAFVAAKPRAGRGQAPHLHLSVFARGLLDRLVTRIYFPDEEAANAADPVLCLIPDPERRTSLVARPDGGSMRFDVHLQGEDETVFFELP